MPLTLNRASFGLDEPRRAIPQPAPGHYRPDIDGLRAIAVVGVILFHYGFSPPTGGFIGVDIFFVISGFLITTILEAETRRGGFSFVGFYERRVRRILPALLVVLLACDLVSTQLLPNDLKQIGMALISAGTFTSNFYFLTLAEDYFGAGSLAIQPALHTWSLGVEAQFYLVFPPLWVLARRWPRSRRAGFVALLAASHGASVWGTAHWPEFSFYLLPTRLWEFLMGGALVLLPRPALGRIAGTLMAIAGVGLIALGYDLIDTSTPFPGAAALLPCLGTALAIAAGGSGPNPVSRLLGLPPLALLGRISYSLYLWHWPVLVFATYSRAIPLPPSEKLGLLALTLLLSVASWLLVERPVIERRWLAGRRALAVACALGILGSSALALAVNLAGQNKIRLASFPPAVLTLANGKYDSVNSPCRPVGLEDPGCRLGAPGVEPSFAIWGNSFARMWTLGLDVAAKRHGAAGIGLLLSKCPPLVGLRFPAIPDCDSFLHDSLAFIEAHPSLKTVIVGGDWGDWIDQLPALGQTIDALTSRGRRVVLLLAPPRLPYNVPRMLALTLLHHEPAPPLLPEAASRAARAVEDAIIDQLHATRTFTTLDPFALLCDRKTCAVERDGHALYYDDAHVTRTAAAEFSSLFDPVFDRTTGGALTPY